MKNRRSHSTIAGNEELSLSASDRGGNAFQRLMEYEISRSKAGHEQAATATMAHDEAREYWKNQRSTGSCRCPADAFIWLTALLSSRGRLPEGADVRQPVKLGQWSHLTRLTPTPHSLKTVALWSAGQANLRDTPARLGIPQRCVFAFYSAAPALGMV
ncbi:MAG: hypothetical protein DSZ33_01425, partial [Gammaproteobacteria bacterium]